MSSSLKEPSAAPRGRPRPLAWTRRVALFERELRLRLTATALDLLLESPELLVEGRVASAVGGGFRFYGTTLLTLRLEQRAELFREPVDPLCATRVAAQLGEDPRARPRLLAVARAAVLERLGHRLGEQLGAEVRVRSEATVVFVDVDLEADLG